MSKSEKNIAEAKRLIDKSVKLGKSDYMLGYIKGAVDAEERRIAKKEEKEG